MPQEITDLDASGVIAAPRKVKLRGDVYTLPGDVPAPLFVQLMAAAERADDPRLIVDVHDEILALFRVYQPELERLPLGLNEMTAAVGAIYRGEVQGDEEGPTKPAASTAKKSRSRSRSST